MAYQKKTKKNITPDKISSAIILEKEYNGETIVDYEEDIRWAIEELDVPIDEHGFMSGIIKIKVTWEQEC